MATIHTTVRTFSGDATITNKNKNRRITYGRFSPKKTRIGISARGSRHGPTRRHWDASEPILCTRDNHDAKQCQESSERPTRETHKFAGAEDSVPGKVYEENVQCR